jgi:hypothetical protein
MLVRTSSRPDLGESALGFPIADPSRGYTPIFAAFHNARDHCLARCGVVGEDFSAFGSLSSTDTIRSCNYRGLIQGE